MGVMAYPRRQNAHRSDGADVTSTSSIIVDEWAPRLELTIVNNSDEDVSLALRVSTAAPTQPVDPTAVADEGIVLKAAGGNWTSTSYTGPVAAITATSVSVAVTEI